LFSKRYIFRQDLSLFCGLVWANHGQAWAFLWALKNFLDLGALTPEEFEKAKAKILG